MPSSTLSPEQLALEKALRELREVYENLAAVHAKCTALTNEKRAMEMAAASLIEPKEWKATVAKALRELTRDQ